MAHNPGNFNITSPISYPTRCGPSVALAVPTAGQTITVGEAIVTNRSGGAADVGLGYLQHTSMWKAGQIDASETPDYVDDTTDAQSGVANSFRLFTTTANDGFMVQSSQKFNVIGLTLTTASSGGTPVYEYSYYDGTNMVVMDQTDEMYAVANFAAAADTFAVFPEPRDWAKGTTAAIGGDADKYAIRVRATTAPSTAGALASVAWVVTFFDFFPQLSDNSALNFEMPTEAVAHGSSGIVPYFGTADAGNTIQLHWRPIG